MIIIENKTIDVADTQKQLKIYVHQLKNAALLLLK